MEGTGKADNNSEKSGKDQRRKRLILAAVILIGIIILAPRSVDGAYAKTAAGERQGLSYGRLLAGDDASADETLAAQTDTVINEVRRGGVYLGATIEDITAAGYEAGDMVSVKIGNSEPVILPFTGDQYGLGFRREFLASDGTDNRLMLHLRGGDFAAEHGIAEDQAGLAVTIRLAEKGAALREYQVWNIGQLSIERSDFPDLSDKEFANFRMVRTTGIVKGVLYRTSSPINPAINRNLIADKANRSAGVTTVINLSETPESAKKHPGYDGSYYASVNHIEVSMRSDYGSEDFNSKLVKSLRFMIAHPGVFEVNCVYGKDRTGFVIAVLEALAGASYEELIEDYTATYRHFYPDYDKYEPIEERDRIIGEGNLIAQLQYAYGIEDLKNADIMAATEEYLKKNGMTGQEIKTLRKCLTTRNYIMPKGTIIKTFRRSSGKAVVRWKKQKSKIFGSHITGYKIQLATDRKFTKNKKTITVKGYKKTSAKVTSLKAKKKYYVKVRTYKVIGGMKYYSPWSKVKTERTR